MKDQILVVVVGLVICLCLFGAAISQAKKLNDACASKGGVLAKTTNGLVCVKAEVLP